jgi:hypothetical protein
MATSPGPSTIPDASSARVPLRLELRSSAVPGQVDGGWWPQSRELGIEAADLVDHFPSTAGRINRLLFSRPDWDDGVVAGHGLRRIQAARGPVKVGSFPRDDTHEMILMMASGGQLRLTVVASDTDDSEGRRVLTTFSAKSASGAASAQDRT